MPTVVEQVVRLRSAVLGRHREYVIDTTAAQAAMATEVDRAFADLVEERVLPERAVILLWRAPTPFLDDAQRGLIELALDDDEAARWVCRQLCELGPLFDASLQIQLDVAHRGLLSDLRGVGLSPRWTVLHGDPRTGFEGLCASVRRKPDLGDLRIAALREADVPAAVAVGRETFTSQPEVGYLSPRIALTSAIQARIDAWAAQSLRTAVEGGTGYAVLCAEELMGYGLFIESEDPLLGRAGGLHICLRREIHGRGVGTRLYQTLLERMLARDVRVFRGCTANPVVLRIGEHMQRELRGWRLEPTG